MNRNVFRIISLALVVALCIPVITIAQDEVKTVKPPVDTLKVVPPPVDTVKYWDTKGNIGITFTQITFTNWAKGGENSISGTSFLNLFADYKKDKIAWSNFLQIAYGIQQLGESGSIRKTDDKFELNSKLGWEQWKNLYWTFLLNFKTQFTRGYDYPNDSVFVSNIFAPAYLILSVGIDYKPTNYLSIYFSPATGKYIYVKDTMLSRKWGVDEGKHIRPEFGWYMTMIFKKDNVIENVNVASKLSMFENYTDRDVKNRGNIDVDWEFMTIFKVNKYLSANFKCQLLYDHNIAIPIYEKINGVKTKIGTGPRTQFMEQFGLGIVFNF